ncbi:uncharacterized protein LOC133344115 isoform X2 [Lethenteron reissneri]|uniref:uncharacterized protein LOC133344115 isoform X2 n=1 Tax=Lethenteron reissneri TaxID=7753 RepID=UPI002AB7D0BF|nr:uncharacterized protein LOC133344115 isoform X2 [Lethenteron reissneri]
MEGSGTEGVSRDPRGADGEVGSATRVMPGSRQARFTVRSARTAPVIGSIQERGEEDYHPHSDGWAPGEQSDSRVRQAALSGTGEPSAETTDERDWGHRGTAGGPGAAAENSEVHSPLRRRGEDDVDPEHPAIDKPSYRRFAAIPVNSLLLDQKVVERGASMRDWNSLPDVACEASDQASSWDAWPGPSESCLSRSVAQRRAQNVSPQAWSGGRETKYATISFNRSPSWDQEKSPATIVYTRPSIWEQQHTEPITKPGRIVSLAREKKEGGGVAGPPSQPRAHRPPHQSPSDLPAAAHSAKVMAAGVSMTTIHENEELPSTLPRVSSRRTQGGWAATPSWNTVPRHHYSHMQGAAGNQSDPEKPFPPFPRISADRKPLYREFAAIPSRHSQEGDHDERPSSGVSFV